MRAIFLALAFAANVVVSNANALAYQTGVTTCDSVTSEKSCMTAKDANGENCSWCNSAAVGGTCFTTSDAKSLPTSVFQCKYQAAYSAAATDCASAKKEKDCMSTSSASGKCSWCNSAAVGGACYDEADAHALPSSVFQCEYQKVALKATDCDGITSEKTCMSSSSGSEKCSWCNSAAVGGTCFVESDAKTLPSSVFQCKYQAVYSAAATDCASAKKEKDCMSTSSASGKCSWCNSAAVGGACYDEADAKSLPSSVFQCEFPAAYSAAATECGSYKKEKDCMSTSSASGKCSWCNSAAVGGACYDEADAHSLPSSVFKCEYQNSKLRGYGN